MNSQPELIKMMNEKLDELTARGIPFYAAKLIVAQAMVITLEQYNVDKETIAKFVAITTK